MTTMITDPFATETEAAPHSGDRKKIITGGRYRLPNRDGSHKSGGWMRVSNLTSAISDQKGLQIWEVRTILEGLADRPDLYEDLQAHRGKEQDRKSAGYRDGFGPIAKAAKRAGGGSIGSDWGTAQHEAWEGLQLDVLPEDVPEWKRLQAVRVALAEAQLQPVPGWQEQRVLIESHEAIGTLDNVLECLRTGLHYIGDLKTQKQFWTFLEIEAQLAMYAHGDARWIPESTEDPTIGRWEDMLPVDRGAGVVMWMPRVRADGTPEVEIKGLDLERGWRTAQTCLEVVRLRSATRSKRHPRSGWSWLSMPDAMRIEQYARRFGSVATLEEGRKLSREAQEAGLWGPELIGAAMRAMEKLRLNGA